MSLTDFGALPDGRTVHALTLTADGLTARLLTLGAIVQDLRLDGVDHPLVLGFDHPDPYLAEGRYVGAIVGRVANRIGGARFTLDGRGWRSDPNFLGRHTLHGGASGTHAQLWRIAGHRPDAALLALDLADGHMGFPGNLRITARISLGGRALRLSLRAETDAATPCSLAHHGFFDLDGRGDIRGHRLKIAAEHYLPVDVDLIPTGRIAPVAGTPFDFRQPRAIAPGGHDHNFCLSDGPRPLRDIAWLTGATGLAMTVATTAEGLQFYDGAGMSILDRRDGRRYGPLAGLALGTQGWPDAPNHPHFPDAILRPGQTYQETTRYVFAAPA